MKLRKKRTFEIDRFRWAIKTNFFVLRLNHDSDGQTRKRVAGTTDDGQGREASVNGKE